jgi:gas vesicle protein
MTEYERFDYEGRGFIGLTLLFVGLALGALTALLFAPQTGRQTRRALRRRYEDTVEGFGDRAEVWRERGREWAGELGRKVAPFGKRRD